MGEDVAVECAVLAGVLLEGSGIGGALLRGEGLHSRLCVLELGFLCGLRLGGCTRVGVADLGGEACAVHLFEDNLRMFADFAPKGLEGDFEFDFGHSSLGLGPLSPLSKGEMQSGSWFYVGC